MDTATISPFGPFSLREAALFGFGQRAEATFDGTMRLAFATDDGTRQVGVAVTQADDGTVSLAGADLADDVVAQVARLLSLDHDATSFADLGRRDPLVGRLQAAAPGLRPPLFHSPYEAAAWAVLANRRATASARTIRDRLSASVSDPIEVAGQARIAFPTPAQLLTAGPVTGVDPGRIDRLHGVARAAQAGDLDVALLRSLTLDAARRHLRTVPGVGPFYAELILLRAVGLTDVLAGSEPRFLALLGTLQGLDRPLTTAEAERVGEGWAPWRTWVSVAVRAAGGRVAT